MKIYLGSNGIPGYKVSKYDYLNAQSYEKYNIQVISDKIKHYALKISGCVDEIYNYNCDNYTIEVKEDKFKIGEYIEKHKNLESQYKTRINNLTNIDNLITKINQYYYSLAICNKIINKTVYSDVAETINKSVNDGTEKVIKEMEIALNTYIENDNTEDILNKFISIHTECTNIYNSMQLLFDKYESKISELSKCTS
jgi:hypothetical protein